jgi:hypothetical protein
MNGGAHEMPHLLDKNFWRSFGQGLSIADEPSETTLASMRMSNHPSTTPEAMRSSEALKMLLNRGFCGVKDIDWKALGVDFSVLARTMDALKAAGWPPVFVYMFDETWRVLEVLFDVTAPLLQVESPFRK